MPAYWRGICASVVVFVHAGAAQTLPLPYRPIDAEYSSALDRIVMVSANPNRLHIYNPANGANVSVDLPKAPSSVSVGPTGLYAAVGHDALISYVNLSTAAVERTYTVAKNVRDLILAANYVHSLPGLSVNLATGAISDTGFGYYDSGGRLHTSGTAIYSTRDLVSPNDIVKHDISTGPLTATTDSPYHGDYLACGQIWFSPNGRRIYNQCVVVYQHSTDPALAMTYLTTFSGVQHLAALSESAAAGKVALIADGQQFGTPVEKDNEVRFFNSDYLVEAGRFLVPDFAVGNQTYQAHGKWIFFNNAGTALHVIAQADTASGLLLDFASHTIEVSNPAPCTVSLSANSASPGAEGGLATVNITNAATCTYRATSNASWLQIISGGYGSGNRTLTYLVRPHSATSSRTGTFTVGGQTFTVTQAAAPGTPPAIARLAYRIVDAEYRRNGDRLVFVTEGPDELHQYDPVARTDTVVPLIRRPLSVSIRPDGLYAAVGHEGWISYVNLQSGAIERLYEIITDVNDLVLAGNGYLYALPQREWSDIYSLAITPGTWTATSAIYDGRIARLHPAGNFMYFGGFGSSKWSIAQGVASQVSFQDFNSCGNFWFSEPGNRMFTACGTVYRASEVPSEDGQYNGMLPGPVALAWAANSSAKQTTVAIIQGSSAPYNTELQLFGDAFLGYAGRYPLPSFSIDGTSYAGQGRYAFWDSASSRMIVLMRADAPNVLSSYGVHVITPGGCTVALGSSTGSLPAAGGFGEVAVTAGASCVWESVSSAPWLSVTAGRVGFGSAGFTFSGIPNNSAGSRTGTITVNGVIFRVTQTGTAGTTAVTPTFVAFGRTGGASSVNVTVDPANLAWGAVSNAAWITVTNAGPGVGNGAVQFSIAANAGAPRTGTLTVAGKTVTISQAGAASNATVSTGIFRGGFFWLQDVDGSRTFTIPPDRAFAFGGLAGDIPISGDWNGDGKAEVGIYRGADGTFLLDLDGDMQFTQADRIVSLGVGKQAGDLPVVGDWNGDGLSKVGLFRQGFFWILDYNGNGVFEQALDRTYAFGGLSGDVPVVGDWDGDGRSNLGLFRAGFFWILDHNGNGAIDNVNQANGDKAFAFGGLPGDVPVTGDWNGDGRSKVGVFRGGFFWVLDANGNQQFEGTGAGQDLAFPFGGLSGDKPLVGRW